MGTEAKVFDCLTGVLGPSKKKSIGSSWSSKSQLIQSKCLTTSSNDACASSGSEAEGCNTELGNGQESVIIGHGANNDDSLIVGLIGDVRGNSGDRNWGSVDAGHEQAAKNDLIEGRVCSAGQEAVELHEQLQVDIVTLWGLSVRAAHVVSVKIDT